MGATKDGAVKQQESRYRRCAVLRADSIVIDKKQSNEPQHHSNDVNGRVP